MSNQLASMCKSIVRDNNYEAYLNGKIDKQQLQRSII